jgi:RNA polymerase sigma factor (sigma-70 family)
MAGPGHSTESEVIEDLVVRSARGERAAQQRLLQLYWPHIRRAVKAYKARVGGFGQREQTEDIAQEAAIRLLEKLPRAEWLGRKAFVAWVKKLSQARAADLRKYHGAQRRDVKADTGVEHADGSRVSRSPESAVDQNARLLSLEQQLDQLKPEYSAAVQFHHLGFTHHEIGAMLGCSAEAARKLVARGHAQLLRLASAG